MLIFRKSNALFRRSSLFYILRVLGFFVIRGYAVLQIPGRKKKEREGKHAKKAVVAGV